MNRKLDGLAFLFKLWGIQYFTKEFLVKQALQGYRKGAQRLDGCRPITFDILQSMFMQTSAVCSYGFEALFHAAFVSYFYGALRVGELVSKSKAAQGGLSAADVRCDGSSVVLFIL